MSDEDVNFEFQRLSLIDKSFSSNATKKAGKCAALDPREPRWTRVHQLERLID